MTEGRAEEAKAERDYKGGALISQIKAENTAWSETLVKDPQMRGLLFFNR